MYLLLKFNDFDDDTYILAPYYNNHYNDSNIKIIVEFTEIHNFNLIFPEDMDDEDIDDNKNDIDNDDDYVDDNPIYLVPKAKIIKYDKDSINLKNKSKHKQRNNINIIKWMDENIKNGNYTFKK